MSFSYIDGNSVRGIFSIRAEQSGSKTVLSGRSVSKPFHLAKPYWTGRVLLVQVANATAGLFAGDALQMDVDVGEGAAVFLTTPSATRIYTMPKGEATTIQSVRVASGGWIEFRPEWIIPQKGSRYVQKTRIECEPGGAIFYVDILAPGRVAKGEVFLYDLFVLELDLFCSGKRVVREYAKMEPLRAPETIWPLRTVFSAAYYATAYLVWPDPAPIESLQAELHEWENSDVWIGCSRLEYGCWSFKILAAHSLALRQALYRLRQECGRTIPFLAEPDRKL